MIGALDASSGGVWVALVIGLVGSTVVHLSQGLLKWGLSRREASQPGSGGKVMRPTAGWVYPVGVALNFTAPLWVVLANRFAPTVFYTSMYASGLVALLVFSRLVLGEPWRWVPLAGALSLLAGAAILTLSHAPVMLGSPGPEAEGSLWGAASGLLTLGGGLLVLAGGVVWLGGRGGGQGLAVIPQGLLLGLIGGGFLALDSLLKGMAQADGLSRGFLPETGAGWGLFSLSFVGAAGAFLLTQWAHLRGAPPAQTVAGYDVAYITLPILALPLLSGSAPPIEGAAGLGWLLLGAGMVGLLWPGKARPSGGDAVAQMGGG